MRSDLAFRRWSTVAVAVSAALAVLAILHLVRHYTHAAEFQVRWLGLEWLISAIACGQLLLVATLRFTRRVN